MRQDYFYFLLSISAELGVHISVDAFASEQDHFLPRFWSMKDNAFGYSWSDEVLFLHPPYGFLTKWLTRYLKINALDF